MQNLSAKPSRTESNKMRLIFLEFFEPATVEQTTTKRIFTFLKKTSPFYNNLYKNKKINPQSFGQRLSHWINKGEIQNFNKGEKLSNGKFYFIKKKPKVVNVVDDEKMELPPPDEENTSEAGTTKKRTDLKKRMTKLTDLLEEKVITKERYETCLSELENWYLTD